MEAKREVLMCSVKCFGMVKIIPERKPLDLLSWRSLVNLVGTVSVEFSTGDVDKV